MQKPLYILPVILCFPQPTLCKPVCPVAQVYDVQVPVHFQRKTSKFSRFAFRKMRNECDI